MIYIRFSTFFSVVLPTFHGKTARKRTIICTLHLPIVYAASSSILSMAYSLHTWLFAYLWFIIPHCCKSKESMSLSITEILFGDLAGKLATFWSVIKARNR